MSHQIDDYLCLICGHTSEEIMEKPYIVCSIPKGKSKKSQINKLRLNNRIENDFKTISDKRNIIKIHGTKAYLNYLERGSQ